MLRLFGNRRSRSLREQLDDAQIGIVEAPELEDEPADAAPDMPRSAIDPEIVLGDGTLPAWAQRKIDRLEQQVAGLQQAEQPPDLLNLGAALRKATEERDALDAELRRVKGQLSEELARSMAEAQGTPAPTGEKREIVDSLREGNQRLRRELRSETDRANRAEAQLAAAKTRIAGLELTCQSLAEPDPKQEGPEVVIVDGTEMVVPWPSRT